MNIKIISGLSGSGKSTAIKKFEDLGYYCIDNLPLPLLNHFLSLCYNSKSEIRDVAIVIDVRSRDFFENDMHILVDLIQVYPNLEIIFLEAPKNVLVERYKETRRTHPLNPAGSILEGIELEIEKLKFLRSKATYIIDTSDMKTRDLAKYIGERFAPTDRSSDITLIFQSFGFKQGIPLDSDLVFDVRFLLNPYYMKELRDKTGLDEEASDYIWKDADCPEFFRHCVNFLDFLIPRYKQEDKMQLVISIGCTGGKHRSVSLTHRLFEHYRDKNMNVIELHRDLSK